MLSAAVVCDSSLLCAGSRYMHENALNPTAFPVLRKFEVEVVQMTLNLFNAPASAVGQ